jgi:hypothetical protein
VSLRACVRTEPPGSAHLVGAGAAEQLQPVALVSIYVRELRRLLPGLAGRSVDELAAWFSKDMRLGDRTAVRGLRECIRRASLRAGLVIAAATTPTCSSMARCWRSGERCGDRLRMNWSGMYMSPPGRLSKIFRYTDSIFLAEVLCQPSFVSGIFRKNSDDAR